jgi:hypothetical protein
VKASAGGAPKRAAQSGVTARNCSRTRLIFLQSRALAHPRLDPAAKCAKIDGRGVATSVNVGNLRVGGS